MNQDIEDYKKAGKIAGEALQYGKSLIKKDASMLEVADKIEAKIKELGGELAFPVQMSLNEAAAHYCPDEEDKTIFSDQLVCLDLGVHINGCIGDTALSVDLSGKYGELVNASKEALKKAIETVKIGATLGEIGKAIEDTIKGFGFKPVKNLSGHGLDKFCVHTPPTIPNFDTGDKTEIKKGMVFAIEPFATNGSGMIHEKGTATVYNLYATKPTRVNFVRQIQKQIESYNGLPFTKRWLTRKFSKAQVEFALKQFKNLEIMKEYPPLVERADGFVSQAEHSILVDDEVIAFTKIE